MNGKRNRYDKAQHNKCRVHRVVRSLDYGHGVMAIEVMDTLGLPRRTTNRHLASLQREGRVKRKGRFWHSNDDNQD